MKAKHKISAILLLAVFLTRIAVLSLHTHEPVYHADYECEQCTHHACHSGHLTEWQLADSECLLCQLCQLPYAMAMLISIASLLLPARYIGNADCRLILCNRHDHIRGRAPPMI
ncbi:MAG: hypothetical protein IKO46_08865 [Salinivirgaceae bacterium]|nr:hypothetical protein [Salinivirgaceae bacterium]